MVNSSKKLLAVMPLPVANTVLDSESQQKCAEKEE